MLAFAPIDGAAHAAHAAVTALADLVAPVAGTSATAVAIVLFTALVRLLISPLSWAQIRGRQRQAALAPRLRELRQRHGDDPARLSQEAAALYREAGTTPLAGCLPALLQLPFFLVMYRLFSTPSSLLDERLLGVPLGWHPTDGLGGVAGLIFAAIVAALGVLAWRASRRMRHAAAEATANGHAAVVGRMLPLLPYAVLLATAVLPLAGDLYLLATTAWTAAEQHILGRAPTTG